MVPGRSMILSGTFPETPISREWSQWLERPLGWFQPPAGGFVNSAVNSILCEPIWKRCRFRVNIYETLYIFTFKILKNKVTYDGVIAYYL